MQVDVNLKKAVDFAVDMEAKTKNLANTGHVFVDMVAKEAKDSGSEFLGGLAEDTKTVLQSLQNKATTAARSREGMEEYIKQTSNIHRLD